MAEGNGVTSEHPDQQKSKRKEVQGCHCWTAFNKLLIRFFASFGELVAEHPLKFIVVPVLVSCFLATGIFRIRILDDPMKLFIPDVSPFIQEKRVVDEHFPMNFTHGFSQSRITGFEGHARAIVSAKDGGSMFRQHLWPEILHLSYAIGNLSFVGEDGIEYNYEELCARLDGQCVENMVLNIQEVVADLERGNATLMWPVSIYPYVLPQVLGGMTLNKSAGEITDVKALLFIYFNIIEPQSMLQKSLQWEHEFIEYLRNVEFEHIKVSFYASRSLGDELVVKMNSAWPYAPATGGFMIVSCMVLLWMKDSVRSKPLIGLIGINSAFMASVAGFGFLMYIGVIYTRLNIIAVFLVLGIGVDDIFVAISAWQKTNPRDSVKSRMAQTYADAAVSVTITSLTNCLSFAIGSSTPIIIVQNFCLYCAVTIVFAYLWFITFCGGFLALAGYMEEKRLHSFLFVKIHPKKESQEEKNCMKEMFMSSDLVQQDVDPNVTVEPHWVSVFFRDTVGDLLCNNTFRVVAVLSLIGYLIGAIYGCIHLEQGLYRYRMSRDDSYLNAFNHDDSQYFRALPYSIQVVITSQLDYSNPQTQRDVMELLTQFQKTSYSSTPLFTQAWIKGFLRQYKRNKDWQQKIVDEPSLIKVLREEYFINPAEETALDVEYNEDFTSIVSTRYVIQTENVRGIHDDVRMMETFRKVASESKFNVTVYHPLFGLFDQHYLLRPLAIQSIVIACLIVMLVSLFFIPNMNGAIAIAFSILSIAAGVLGYMGFWNINLDQVSVGSIFMCIGFSVDFSAHITYTYLSCHETTSEGRIRASLFGLGLPIMQGAITTILSLATFLMIPGYGYRTFFKTIFLVTIFAVYFSIVLIPLLLTLLDYLFTQCKRSDAEPVSGIQYTKKQGSFKIPRIPMDNDGVTKVPPLSNGKSKGVHNGMHNGYQNGFSNGGSKSLTNGNGVVKRPERGAINEAYIE